MLPACEATCRSSLPTSRQDRASIRWWLGWSNSSLITLILEEGSVASIAEQAAVLDGVGRRGALVFEFERSGMRTVLVRASCLSPWHYFPPAYLDDSGCAYTWLVNPSGGLVGGDHVTVEARFDAGTHVVMTSPSANRVYRSISWAFCARV